MNRGGTISFRIFVSCKWCSFLAHHVYLCLECHLFHSECILFPKFKLHEFDWNISKHFNPIFSSESNFILEIDK